MSKKVNLIITTYAGRYYKFNTNRIIAKDKENYLKYTLLFINNNINNLEQITIMKPRVNSEHSIIPNYYDFNLLDIDNIRHKIKIYECDNIGISYGQLFTAIMKDPDFDYHIFIEDDYFPFVNNFDDNLINIIDTFPDETYLCSFIIEKKINIFNKKNCATQESIKKVKNYFDKYNYFQYNIFIPDFSLGIICKKSVNKLINKFQNLDEILELYKIKFENNWVYQILFGYTLNIAGINIKDYNDIFLNIFYCSTENKIQLCNVGSDKFKNWETVKNFNKKYKLPLFLPVDILFPRNYTRELKMFNNYLCEPQQFHDNLKVCDIIKIEYTRQKNIIENKKICIYISKSHCNYLPFVLYANSIFEILNKNITNNVIITFSVDDVIKFKPEILFLFSINLNDIINCFYPKQIKFIINTENYKTWKLVDKLNTLNSRHNINFLEYNPLNVKFIQENYKNINVLFIPQLYHNSLIKYYDKLIKNKKLFYSAKNIDILFYGNENIPRRKNMLKNLSQKFNVKIIHKVNDDILFGFINRSKIVINIYSNEDNKPFDYYRNIFLFANKILLVSEYPRDIDLSLEPYFKNITDNLLVPEYNDMISCIENILENYNDHSYIDSLIQKQFDFVSQLDMEEITLDNLKIQ